MLVKATNDPPTEFSVYIKQSTIHTCGQFQFVLYASAPDLTLLVFPQNCELNTCIVLITKIENVLKHKYS